MEARRGTTIAARAVAAAGSVAAVLALTTLLSASTSSAASSRQTPRAAGSAKRGVASSRYLAADPRRLRRIGARWAYDWSATPPPAIPGLEWVPMTWGAGSVTPRSLAVLRAAARSGRARYLLAFNEPDSRGQSNLSPEQAAALWPSLERTGLAVGSPAPQVPNDGWLSRFMSIAHARHLRVAFIALHYYQDFTSPGAVDSLRRQLVAIHAEYRLPLWVTEIGALDISRWGEYMTARPTAAAAASYLRRLFAMLDGLPFVQRYAWFTDQCWNDTGCRFGSLFDGRGALTSIGAAFAHAG